MRAKFNKKNDDELRSEQFKKYLNFLLFINETPKNRELMTDFYLEKFADSPENFFRFLTFIKEQLNLNISGNDKSKFARLYLAVLAHLCERFGFFEEKYHLNDICFKIIDPKKYREIDQMLIKYKKQSGSLVNKVQRILKNLLKAYGHPSVVKGRYKNIYSIHRKLQKNSAQNALQLIDIFAFRIILKNNYLVECFEVLNLLNDHFQPITGAFKDYITIPKINGYQSIHIGLNNVIPKLDIPVEIQIRTQLMDDFAEKGFAAHFLYDREKKSKIITETEKMLAKHFAHLAKNAEIEDMVYFFSYQGDLFKLKKGSNIIHFASRIHSDLTKKASCALVNGEKKELNHQIQEGDQIKILKK